MRISQRPDAAGKRRGDRRRVLVREAGREAERVGVEAEQRARPAAPSSRSPARLTSRSRRSGSNAKTATSISSITVRSSAGRLERAEALLAQRLGERVDLDQDLAERIVAARAARADREVPLAQRREQVRQRLQREDDALAQRDGDARPEADDEQA